MLTRRLVETSGTVAIGEKVTGVGVPALTAVDANISESALAQEAPKLLNNALSASAGRHHNDSAQPHG